jgi:dephospho-CoA kinase
MQWMESAILYESGASKLVDCVIVVTAPEQVRIHRIMQRDQITEEKALEWINRQWPQDEVRRRADYEIINDGQVPLEQQIDHIITSLHIISK